MRKIVITSGKGGVGKTTVTASLGRRLADMGFKVVLADADVGLNNLDVVTGVESRVVYDIGDVIAGKCTVFQALVPDHESGARILPSAGGGIEMSAQAFRGVMDSVTVIADGSALNFMRPAELYALFGNALDNAIEAARGIEDRSRRSISLVVNRVRPDMVARGEMMEAADIARLLGTPAIGVIPEDDCVTLYQQLGRVPSFALSERAFELLADNVACRTKKCAELRAGRRRRRRWL